MNGRGKVLTAMVAVAVMVAGGAFAAAASRQGAPSGAAGGADTESAEVCERQSGGKTQEIATAKLIIEFNSTDDDMGVHGAFDDHGWSQLCVFDPSGRPVLEVGPQNQLRDLTMAGIFFESREPPGSEFSYAHLMAAFPEGEYPVEGLTFDGKLLVGSATFTHDVPAPPVITSPALADEPRGARRDPLPLQGLIIDWNQVAETIAGDAVAITGYEVIVTKENHEDPSGFSRPIYDVHVPSNVTRLSVPAEFLQSGTVYEVEVLALETSGNQTITVGFFKTA